MRPVSIGWISLLLAIGACSVYPAGVVAPSLCGEGAELARNGHQFCAYESSAVGDRFTCPEVVPNRYDGEAWVVCADVQGLTSEEVGEVAREAGVAAAACSSASDCNPMECEVCLEQVCTRSCPGVCASDGVCGGGGGSSGECQDVADCYPAGYCTSAGGCRSIQPGGGASENDCAIARLAPPQDPGGPVIWAPGQDVIGEQGGTCTKEPVSCMNNGDVCQFSFQVYDPDGDLPQDRSSSYRAGHLVTDEGTLVPMYDVPAIVGGTVRVRVCFAEQAQGPVLAAVVLDDLAGHHSNALCLAGTSP